MNIYNNYLPQKDFKNIQSYLISEKMTWSFINGVNHIGDGFFKFTYVFLDRDGIQNNNMIDIINPILTKINPKKFYSIKANLLTKTNNIVEHGLHTDFDKGADAYDGKTAVYYINTCNGYTKFENNSKIKSDENKFVEFDTKLKHTSSSCTDEKTRIVINLNYCL
jgi:hypothetical protein|tara:strand:- start:55 stop:549 length:495 start_codon:yes stop_codon:yes gene_type:complete